MQNLEKNWSVVSKMTRISWNLTRALKSLQNLHFHLFLLCKRLFHLKKYKGAIFHDTEWWCKIWRKTDLWFRKWHEEYGKFSPELLKVSKLELWWDPLIQSRKGVSLKFSVMWVMCHDTEEWWKTWKEIDLLFQDWYEEFDEVLPKHLKVSKIFILMCPFWEKDILFELKK